MANNAFRRRKKEMCSVKIKRKKATHSEVCRKGGCTGCRKEHSPFGGTCQEWGSDYESGD